MEDSAYALDCVGVVRPVPGLEESSDERLLSVPVRSRSRSLSLSPLLLPLKSPPLPATDPDPDVLLRPVLELALALPSVPPPASVEALVPLALNEPTLPSSGKFVLLTLPVTSLSRNLPLALALALGLRGGREEAIDC
jgi:hypothetical protein